jgi:retron-type reverse transcriptase
MSFLTALKTAKSLHDVAYLLGYKPKSLSYVIYKMPVKYETFTVPKKSGGLRTISAPRPELKLLQRRLSDCLQSCWDEINKEKNSTKPISHGFRKGASILTNARVHRGRRFVFNVDIQDFFDSINFGRVYGFFAKNKDFALTENVAKILAAIACHDGKLPQGSPCSPVISNLIGQILDIRLAKLAKKYGCSYSRYADDLTFSTNERIFPSAIAVSNTEHSWTAGPTLSKIIQKSGFQLNPKKTRMQYRNSRQEVTGLVVNRRINSRPEYRRLARAMTHQLLTTGKFHIAEVKADALGSLVTTKVDGSIRHLQGMFGFIDWVDLIHKKARGTLDGDPSSIGKIYRRFLMHRDFWASSLPVILCEGKTDSIYLRGAIRRLATAHPNLVSVSASGKAEYKVRFFNYSYTSQRILDLSGGAPAVKTFITKYIKSVKEALPPANQSPLIVLLDNDPGGKVFYNAIKEYNKLKTPVSGMDDFYHLAANVYIVFTPIAKTSDNSSIEDFFEPSLLETKIDGKSFNPNNDGHDFDTEYGKVDFATKIVRPNIDKINFNKFDPILIRMESAITAHIKKATP